MKVVSMLPIAAAVSMALLAAPSVAQADTVPSFDHIGLSYADVDLYGASPTGFTIDAEKSLKNGFFLAGDLLYFSESESFQGYSGETDFSFFNANVNYQFVQHEGFVAYAGAGVSYLGVDSSVSYAGASMSESDSETGWNAMVGMRQAITSSFELDANVRHLDIGDGTDQVISVSARFFPTERVSLNLGYTNIDSDFTYVELGASYHF